MSDNKLMTSARASILFALFAASLFAQIDAPPATAQQLLFTPFNSDGIYRRGEKAGWTASLPAGVPGAKYTYTIKKNNLDVLKSGTLDLSSGSATIEITLGEPAMIYVDINAYPSVPKTVEGPMPAARPRPVALGAAVAPSELQLSTPRPADFDSFWDAKLKALAQVPINPVLTPLKTDVPGVELSLVKLDSLGSNVQGYFAKPAREGKFPALVVFQYAGVYALQTNTVTSKAVEGWLTLDVDSHDMPPTEAAGVSRNYQAVGNTDRETSYFLNMYLRDARAIDYIASRPDWDGKTIVLMGTSMGGQQSLVTAGSDPIRSPPSSSTSRPAPTPMAICTAEKRATRTGPRTIRRSCRPRSTSTPSTSPRASRRRQWSRSASSIPPRRLSESGPPSIRSPVPRRRSRWSSRLTTI